MHRWIEHTADLALELRARGPMELLTEAIAALAATWLPGEGAAATDLLDGEIRMGEPTLEELLVNLMNEQIFQAAVRGVSIDPGQVTARGRLEDTVEGWSLAVPRGPLYRPLPGARSAADHLKAATHHGLEIRSGDDWTAIVVIHV